MAIKVFAEDGLALTAAPSSENAAFASSAVSLDAANAVLHLHLAPLRREYAALSLDRQLLALGQSAFCRTKSGGYVQLSCPPDGKPAWMLSADAAFSRFDCFVDAKETIDPYQHAANRFFLQHSFIRHNGLIVHAAGGSIQGKGIVFAAPSGIGKSTLSHLLLASPQNRLFSEERLIVRSADAVWKIWGTPWRGTGSIARNESAPLAALVFLSQAPETTISALSASDALRRLLQVASIPWYSEEWTNRGLAVCESLIQNIPMFELAFRPDQSAVQVVEQIASSLD